MLRRIASIAIGSILFSLPSPAQAAGLDFTSGWSSAGDAAVTGDALVTLSSDGLFGDDLDLGAGNGEFNFSGIPASSIGFGTLEAFLGIDVSELDLGGIAYEGSAIKTTLTIATPSELRFHWRFLTNETAAVLTPGRGPFEDYGFVLIGQSVYKLADYRNTTTSGTCERGFDRCTGDRIGIYPLSPGTYPLAFGAIDIGDTAITSALSAGGITVTPRQATPVPEPASLSIYLAAILLGAILRKCPSTPPTDEGIDTVSGLPVSCRRPDRSNFPPYLS